MESTLGSKLLIGETRAKMRALPAGCVHCVATSPPYWGLRDYGIPPVEWSDGSLAVFGLEKTPEEFITHAVEVFGDVRRILRDDGVVFLNLGDSYNAGGRVGHGTREGHKQGTNQGTVAATDNERPNVPGLKDGDLMNMPHRVVEALQADGWYWRSTIVWAKRSPMPESING